MIQILKVYPYKLTLAFITTIGKNSNFGSIFKYPNNHVTLVADQLPLGDTGRVKDKYPSSITINTSAHSKIVDAMTAGWVSAIGAVGASLHSWEWRIAVTVGTKDK